MGTQCCIRSDFEKVAADLTRGALLQSLQGNEILYGRRGAAIEIAARRELLVAPTDAD